LRLFAELSFHCTSCRRLLWFPADGLRDLLLLWRLSPGSLLAPFLACAQQPLLRQHWAFGPGMKEERKSMQYLLVKAKTSLLRWLFCGTTWCRRRTDKIFDRNGLFSGHAGCIITSFSNVQLSHCVPRSCLPVSDSFVRLSRRFLFSPVAGTIAGFFLRASSLSFSLWLRCVHLDGGATLPPMGMYLIWLRRQAAEGMLRMAAPGGGSCRLDWCMGISSVITCLSTSVLTYAG